MPRTKRIGLISFFVGVLAICLATSAIHMKASHNPAGGVVLAWLAKIGVVQQTVSTTASLSEASVFSINDENALQWLLFSAVASSVLAMVVAVVAELRREHTLFLSCGFIFGALSIALIKPVAGLASLIGGFTFVMAIRRQRKQNDT
ncbi:MAG: hypothetical protein HYU78_11460 [Rhodocyclales bacterium]|jgi:hypothetical protein|nr:hypothetical protein [Rhodocyclales bacterium]